MDALLIHLLNGLGAGLLLFMLSAGLTLIFSLMGVLNFAHASFYMLGAYVGCSVAGGLGFGAALVLAPVIVGVAGAAFERFVLRRVHRHGHVAELLATFGLAYVVHELVQLAWGRSSLPFEPPEWLRGAAFTMIRSAQDGFSIVLGDAPAGRCGVSPDMAVCTPFPLTRAFMAAVALAMLGAIWLALERTRIGLVIRAALTHPQMVGALGHDVPRVFMLVFGGGCALAALAGVVGGVTFVTEPGMAAVMGSVVFVVVVVGGVGSLPGAFAGSLLVGMLQTLPLALDTSIASALNPWGAGIDAATPGWPIWRITLAQAAPMLPYLLLVAMLVLRPRGLLGPRAD